MNKFSVSLRNRYVNNRKVRSLKLLSDGDLVGFGGPSRIVAFGGGAHVPNPFLFRVRSPPSHVIEHTCKLLVIVTQTVYQGGQVPAKTYGAS